MQTQIVKSMLRIPAGMVIFLLALVPTVIVRRIVVAAKLPRSVDKLITYVYAIIEAMTDNTWFPTPPIDDVKAKVGELKDAQIIAKTRIPGAAKERNVKLENLMPAFSTLKDYVQGICRLNPESGITIAESALMHAKKVPGGKKHVFSVKQLTSGSIELIGGFLGNHQSHDWGLSRNPVDPLSWYITIIPSTLKAKTVVNNLKPGETVYLRHRVVTKVGPGDWDQTISFIVK